MQIIGWRLRMQKARRKFFFQSVAGTDLQLTSNFSAESGSVARWTRNLKVSIAGSSWPSVLAWFAGDERLAIKARGAYAAACRICRLGPRVITCRICRSGPRIIVFPVTAWGKAVNMADEVQYRYERRQQTMTSASATAAMTRKESSNISLVLRSMCTQNIVSPLARSFYTMLCSWIIIN